MSNVDYSLQERIAAVIRCRTSWPTANALAQDVMPLVERALAEQREGIAKTLDRAARLYDETYDQTGSRTHHDYANAAEACAEIAREYGKEQS